MALVGAHQARMPARHRALRRALLCLWRGGRPGRCARSGRNGRWGSVKGPASTIHHAIRGRCGRLPVLPATPCCWCGRLGRVHASVRFAFSVAGILDGLLRPGARPPIFSPEPACAVSSIPARSIRAATAGLFEAIRPAGRAPPAMPGTEAAPAGPIATTPGSSQSAWSELCRRRRRALPGSELRPAHR